MKKQVTQKAEKKERKKRFRLMGLIAVIGIIAAFSFTSCEVEHYHGYDGRPGDAYMALSWDVDQPEYLDVGTSVIPEIFYWDEYYRAYPGVFVMYYDGEIWNGRRWVYYAWEMEYEIWRINGEPGGHGYDGTDGPDSYFTLIFSPFGPELYEEYVYYKKLKLTDEEIEAKLETLKEEGEISKTIDGYGIKMKFKKVEPRQALK